MASERETEEILEDQNGDLSVALRDEIEIPSTMPLLPVRDIVVFPFMIIPLFVGRERSINAVNAALANDRIMMLATQKDPGVESPEPGELYTVGAVVMVLRMLKLPDGRVKILVQGLTKGKITRFVQKKPFYTVKVREIAEAATPDRRKRVIKQEAMLRIVREQLSRTISMGKQISPDILVIAENLDEPGRLADLIAANLSLKVAEAQAVLTINDPSQRLQKVSELLNREIQLLGMQQKIESAAQGEMTKSQREYYLREQLKAIQTELGESDDKTQEIEELREKIIQAAMPSEVLGEAKKQLNRLAKMHVESAEATTVRTFLEWLTEIPWSKRDPESLDLRKAQEVLDKDHYDLEKVKERIIEYLAVRKLKSDMKGPILCLVGPPGVGKTSLGQSVARALGRKFVRISLGGVRDEAEIRGHRRTYIGSLPGKIIQGIKQAGSNNPVFMMDEIDKLGSDFRGDPSSALLEVLDPEQNNKFVDHYLGVPFDLTNVMFITTANMVDTIPAPLRDRMEIIRLAGYTEAEKLNITKRYIIPRQVAEHGILKKHIKLPDATIRDVIRQYTREAGLRGLERNIARICRKVAKSVASGRRKQHRIERKDLKKYLGPQIYIAEPEQERDMVGVATGVAWTQVGGEIMHIETSVIRGSGKLALTGKLGDVMKESAQAAMTYIRARSEELGLDPLFASKTDAHIHVPAGAVPKDGPSAGITIATALTSALTGIPVRKDITMTGEITLRGQVLPIGGLKEKALAAHRAGIYEMIIPRENRKDLPEIPENIRKQMKFHIASKVEQVLDWALTEKAWKNKPGSLKKAPVAKAIPKAKEKKGG